MRCKRCNRVFQDMHGIFAAPGTQITVTGVQVSCPHCGGMAVQIQEGTFKISKTGHWRLLADALRPADVTPQDYRLLYETLKAAKEENASAEELAEQIANRAPRFRQLGEFLLSPQGSSLGVWLTLILMLVLEIVHAFEPESPQTVINNYTTVITTASPSPLPAKPAPTPDELRTYIETAVRQAEQGKDISGITMPHANYPRTRPCWCGSGEKFKRCHAAGSSPRSPSP